MERNERSDWMNEWMKKCNKKWANNWKLTEWWKLKLEIHNMLSFFRLIFAKPRVFISSSSSATRTTRMSWRWRWWRRRWRRRRGGRRWMSQRRPRRRGRQGGGRRGTTCSRRLVFSHVLRCDAKPFRSALPSPRALSQWVVFVSYLVIIVSNE